MKVKNLAFFGVMATILGVGGAYADNATIIASKNYVDNQVGTKVTKNADITAGTKTKITYDAKGLVTAGADLTASDIPDLSATYEKVENKETGNTLTDSTTKYPSSHTVKAAIGAIDMSSKVDVDQTATNKDKVMVTDGDGTVLPYTKDEHIALDHDGKKISITGFQAPIDDLETIRSGASAGATAVQPAAISDMETQTHAAATYETQTHASSTYETQAHAAATYLTSHQDISGKVNVDQTAANKDKVLVTDGEGKVTTYAKGEHISLADGKIDATGFQAPLTFDDSPSANSSNPVKSSGIKSALDDKQDKLAAGHVTVTGDGNAITSVTAANGVITATKGTTFLTQHQSLDSRVAVQQEGTDKNKVMATDGTGVVKPFATDEHLVLDGSKISVTGFQAPIDDLDTIRAGATSGSSAIQSVKLNGTALTATNGAVDVTNVVEGVATVTGTGEAITAVTEDANHKVAATKSKLTYAGAMDATLNNINGGGAECTAAKPCVLSYADGTYTWTNKDLGN